MFKTLLVGLDGSHDSEAAIPVAADIAGRYDALVVLCHVEERVVGKGGPQPIRDVETIQAGIQARAKELSDQGIATSQIVAIVAVAVGSVTDRLLHVSERCVLAVPPPESK